MAAADSRAALSRSRVVARILVHAAQVVGLVVLLRAFAEFPWAAAAAAPSILRFAASYLSPQCLCFLALNVIVILLARASPSDAASSSPWSADPSGSPSSNGDAEHPFLAFLVDRPPTLQPITEAEATPPEQVFEDKQVVHVKTVPVRAAQPPRRTMSDKTRDGAAAAAGRTSTAAASPELRRAKSDNGGKRRQQRRSVAAAAAATATAAAPAELVTDDAEAFRLVVEAFIAKQQTWFHREESLIVTRAAAAAAGGGGEDGPAIGGGAAAVAVK